MPIPPRNDAARLSVNYTKVSHATRSPHGRAERAVAVSFEIEQWLVEDQAKLWGKEKTEEELQLPGLNVDKPYGGSSSFYQDGTPR